MDDEATTRAALAAPFDPSEVKWKPQAVSNGKAMAVAYVDARAVQDRLDDVLGIDGWQDSYTILEKGTVKCTLRIRFPWGGDWITREDVGDESEQPDDGDRAKSAFSDALKRAAVKFGIGRYLYRLPRQWVEYDAQRKRIAATPQLPAWAMPQGGKKPAPAAVPAPAPTQPASQKSDQAEPLHEKVASYEAKLVERKLCQPNDLFRFLVAKLGDRYEGSVDQWPEGATGDVRILCQAFKAERSAKSKQPAA